MIGMLQWHRYETAVQLGYEHALQVLDGAKVALD